MLFKWQSAFICTIPTIFIGINTCFITLIVTGNTVMHNHMFYRLITHVLTHFPSSLFNKSEKQEEIECLVLPPISQDGPLGLLLDYNDTSDHEQCLTHRVQTTNGSEFGVRLMVKISATDVLIDPLDFRYHNGN